MQRIKEGLRPDFTSVKMLYPLVLDRLLRFEEFCDNQKDDMADEIFQNEYQKMQNDLEKIVSKNLSNFHLWEWWECEGVQVLAFDIAMSEPTKHQNLTKDDLKAFVSIIKENKFNTNDEFVQEFMPYMFNANGYFHKFLKLNFKGYNIKFFNRQKAKNGEYYELSVDEIVDKIYNCESI